MTNSHFPLSSQVFVSLSFDLCDRRVSLFISCVIAHFLKFIPKKEKHRINRRQQMLPKEIQFCFRCSIKKKNNNNNNGAYFSCLVPVMTLQKSECLLTLHGVTLK